MRAISRVDRVIFQAYRPSAESLALFRVGYALFLLVLALPRHQWIAAFPDTFFAPPIGLTYFFFTGFPAPWMFQLLDAVLVVASVCLLCGRGVVAASWTVGAALLVGNAWSYSFGKINHDLLFMAAPPLLALAGWSGRGPVCAWPMALYAWMIAWAMFTAAWQKAVSGWLDPSTQAVLAHTLANISMTGRGTIAATLALQWTPRLAWEAQDIATVALEGAFVLVWPWRTGFRVACALACVFHLGVALLMRIAFYTNLIAYGAFVEWRDVPGASIVARVRGWFEERTVAQVLAGGLAISALYLTFGNPIVIAARALGVHDDPVPPMHAIALALSLVSVVIAAGFLWRLATLGRLGRRW